MSIAARSRLILAALVIVIGLLIIGSQGSFVGRVSCNNVPTSSASNPTALQAAGCPNPTRK